MDGGWWMVDILFLMLYIKFGCHHHHHQKSLNLQDEANVDQMRKEEEVSRVNIGHLRVTVGLSRSL